MVNETALVHCSANQVTGFYMTETMALNMLKFEQNFLPCGQKPVPNQR